jgi:hypothetical protein
MLGLWLWRLEWTGEDGNLHIAQLLRHLGVREVLVDNDALHQHAVLHTAAHLSLYLDQLKIDVPRLQVGNGHDGVHGNLCHLFVALVNDLGAECGLGRTD